MKTVCIVQTLLNLHNIYGLEGLTRSNSAQVTIECMYGQLSVYRQWSPAEIETQTHWNLIAHGMIVPLPVISPSNILQPPFSQCAFIPTRKNLACVVKNVIISLSLYFFKNCVSLKLHNSGSVSSSKGL